MCAHNRLFFYSFARINTPLLFRKGLGVTPKKNPAFSRPLKGEDADLVEKALAGEYIPASVLDELNEERIKKGQPILLVHYGKYADDDEKGVLYNLRQNAKADFRHLTNRRKMYIGDLNRGEKKAAVVEKMKQIESVVDQDTAQELDQELGAWFTDYLASNGYDTHMSATLTKQMILTAFPPIARDQEKTTENIEERLLNADRVYSRFIQLEGDEEYMNKFHKLIASQGSGFKIY
jgi:hypothetical protein